MKGYHVDVCYSDEDEAYIADIPDLRHCAAFGATPQEALAEVAQSVPTAPAISLLDQAVIRPPRRRTRWADESVIVFRHASSPGVRADSGEVSVFAVGSAK